MLFVRTTKQDLQINGLQSTVEILRDQWGVNHIYANNQHDLFCTRLLCSKRSFVSVRGLARAGDGH